MYRRSYRFWDQLYGGFDSRFSRIRSVFNASCHSGQKQGVVWSFSSPLKISRSVFLELPSYLGLLLHLEILVEILSMYWWPQSNLQPYGIIRFTPFVSGFSIRNSYT